MSERRVRGVERAVYGSRPQPIRGRRAGVVRRPQLGLIPRRLLLLLAGGLVLVFILRQTFQITTVQVKSQVRAPEIQTEVQKLLAMHWQQQNLLTLNGSVLENDLIQADPMVKSAEVRRHWIHGITVNVVLKQPSLGWSSGNQIYLLDRDGSAIGSFAPGTDLPVVVDGSNLPVELGRRATTARFVGFTSDIARTLAELKMNATRYEVKDTTLDLYVTTGKGYQIIFDTSRSAQDEAHDLQSLLGFLNGKVPTQYIDLRIAGKAYYK